MEMIEMWVIEAYCGQSNNGLNWFNWNEIPVPKCKESFIHRMNNTIPFLFELSEEERKGVLDSLLVEHNNGINQYFPFLRDFASKETMEFINAASGSDMLNGDQANKTK